MKRINGSWLEIHHFNEAEGKYFNPICHEFSDIQWKEKVKEMAKLNMKYIVLISVVFTDNNYVTESFYPSKYYPKCSFIKASEPIKAILEEASLHGMKVFLGAGILGPFSYPYENMTSKKVEEDTLKVMKEVYELYGHYDSFYGWYYPDETGINEHFEQEYINYVNARSNFSKTLNPNLKNLIAPYGTRHIITDEKYVNQLKKLEVDFVAYQDEVGVKKTTSEYTPEFYKRLKQAHDLANKSKLWADVESFDFEGVVYKSALIPSNIDRLEKQLIAVSPYVEEILIFQYQGMISDPSSISFCGHPDSIKYYKDYIKLLESKKSID